MTGPTTLPFPTKPVNVTHLARKMVFPSKAFDQAQKVINGPIPPPPLGLFSGAIRPWFLMFGRLLATYMFEGDRLSALNMEALRRLDSANIPLFTGPFIIKFFSVNRSLRLISLYIDLYLMGILDRFFLQERSRNSGYSSSQGNFSGSLGGSDGACFGDGTLFTAMGPSFIKLSLKHGRDGCRSSYHQACLRTNLGPLLYSWTTSP